MDSQALADRLPLFRGELALAISILVDSFGVILMLYSGAGISAISSVPYAFSVTMPFFSLGTWTYIFQALLVSSLMILRHRFVLSYLFSFVVGFVFSMLLDLHELWIVILPTQLGWRIFYFILSYFLLCIGISLANRCGLPIVPTDLFPRELAQITGVRYSRIKTAFDAICLVVTAAMTYFLLGHIDGLGIGTVLAALTLGKSIGMVGSWFDRHFRFVTHLFHSQTKHTV